MLVGRVKMRSVVKFEDYRMHSAFCEKCGTWLGSAHDPASVEVIRQRPHDCPGQRIPEPEGRS